LNLAFVGRFKDELDDVQGPRWTISHAHRVLAAATTSSAD
jgi:hypothetical protein